MNNDKRATLGSDPQPIAKSLHGAGGKSPTPFFLNQCNMGNIDIDKEIIENRMLIRLNKTGKSCLNCCNYAKSGCEKTNNRSTHNYAIVCCSQFKKRAVKMGKNTFNGIQKAMNI